MNSPPGSKQPFKRKAVGIHGSNQKGSLSPIRKGGKALDLSADEPNQDLDKLEKELNKVVQ